MTTTTTTTTKEQQEEEQEEQEEEPLPWQAEPHLRSCALYGEPVCAAAEKPDPARSEPSVCSGIGEIHWDTPVKMRESDEAGASEHQVIQEPDTGFVGWRGQPTAARFMTASENFRYGAHAAPAWPDVPECYQHCICDNTDAEYECDVVLFQSDEEEDAQA
jgi:hypothetical protein